jgi:hypothetical protein
MIIPSMGFGFFSSCLKFFIENIVDTWVFAHYIDLIWMSQLQFFLYILDTRK